MHISHAQMRTLASTEVSSLALVSMPFPAENSSMLIVPITVPEPVPILNHAPPIHEQINTPSVRLTNPSEPYSSAS